MCSLTECVLLYMRQVWHCHQERREAEMAAKVSYRMCSLTECVLLYMRQVWHCHQERREAEMAAKVAEIKKAPVLAAKNMDMYDGKYTHTERERDREREREHTLNEHTRARTHTQIHSTP